MCNMCLWISITRWQSTTGRSIAQSCVYKMPSAPERGVTPLCFDARQLSTIPTYFILPSTGVRPPQFAFHICYNYSFRVPDITIVELCTLEIPKISGHSRKSISKLNKTIKMKQFLSSHSAWTTNTFHVSQSVSTGSHIIATCVKMYGLDTTAKCTGL